MLLRHWVLAVATGGTLACDLPAWRKTFDRYWREYPKAEAGDLYKLAHQGIMGSEHAVGDTAAVQAWMQREVNALPGRPEPPPHSAPLVEPLPPAGRYVRVHLRPFLARKGDVPQLLRAFVATANGPKGDTAQFACAEQALSSMAPGRVVQPTLALFAQQRRVSFAAVHHSETFEAAYAPAYRVIAADWLARLGIRTSAR